VAFCVITFHVSANTVPNLKSRIFGGNEAKPNALPWNTAIINVIAHDVQCGGTIICPRFVITAAHCVSSVQPQQLEIVAGVHNWSKDEPTQTRHKVKMFHINPKYEPELWKYDLALIELADPIDLRPEARAAFLPENGDPILEVPWFVANGWGYWTRDNPQRSKVLRSVTIPWVPDEMCRNSYPDIETADLICAGDYENGKIGGCNGDGGSPISWMDPETDQVKVVGIILNGKDPVCIAPKYPGLHCDISKQLKWVEGIIGECNKETCASGWCTTKDDLDPWAIEQFSRITPHRKGQEDQVVSRDTLVVPRKAPYRSAGQDPVVLNIKINTIEKA